MDNASLEQILDKCIDRLARGGDIEQCLQDYPGRRAELEPLLRVALMTREACAVEPRSEFKIQARRQLHTLLYRRKPKAQLRRFFSLDWARPRVGNGMEGLKARPAFQKALASMAAVALVVGVCFAVPALLGQSPVALAEELVADDAGVQILLAEEGFDLSDLRKVALKSDEGNIYQVHLINPKDEVPMGTVTVDVDQRMVTRVEFLASSKEYVQSFAPIGMMTMEGVVEGMSGDARVRELLDGGAEVGKASCFSSLSSPQRQMAGLELRLGDKVWLVEVDPNGGEVMSMSERHR